MAKNKKMEPTVLAAWIGAGAVVVGAIIAACFSRSDHHSDPEPHESFRPVYFTEEELKFLTKIKPIAPCPPRGAGMVSFTTLGESLLNANPEIQKIVEEIRSASNEGRALHEVTRVCAPAGSGKSTLFRYLEELLPDRSYVIKLDELRRSRQIKMVSLPDLQSDDGVSERTFSWMPAFDPSNPVPSFLELMSALAIDYSSHPRPLLIVDSIDEIHPTSSTAVLEQIDAFIEEERNRDPKGIVRVLAIGRPEGFVGYYLNPHPDKRQPLLELALPSYKDQADLRRAAELMAESNGRDTKAVEAFLRLAHRYPFVCESASNFALLAELIKNAVEFERQNLSDREIKNHLFNFLLARNRASHNRPARENQDYIALLERISTFYHDSKSVNPNGYFIVDSQSVAVLQRLDGRTISTSSYRIVDTLSRSGVAYLNPVDLYNPMFRFYPSWVHEHLAHLNNRDEEKRASVGRH